MTSSIEERIRAIAAAGQGSGELPAQVRTAVRRRQARARLAAGGAAAGVAAGVVAIVVVTTLAGGHASGRAGGRSTTLNRSSAAPNASPPPRPTFAPLAPVVPADTGEPPTFFASIGAGAERLAVVDSSSGVVKRYLQTPAQGTQAIALFDHDLSTAYQPGDKGLCTSAWVATDTTTGARSPAFTDLGKPLEVALTATGDRIAYVHEGPQRQVKVPDGDGGTTTVAGGCPTAKQTLVVLDRTTGAHFAYALPSHEDFDLFPAWDPTGTQIAFVLHGRVRILDVNTDDTIASARPLSQRLAHGCQQIRPMWQPGTNTVLVNQMCGHQGAIVGFDADTGQQTYRHRVAGGSPFFTYDVDASGKHLIYTDSGPVGSAQGQVYVVEPRGDRHVMDGSFDVAW